MSEQNLDQLLSGVVDTVMETMFFSTPRGPAEPEAGASVLKARVAFRGRPSGALRVCLSAASARILAAGFLGEDEAMLTDSQPGEVVCEFANMLCGLFLSRLESDESFDLNSPELVPVGSLAAPGSEALPAASQSFGIEEGVLTVTLHLEATA